MNPRTMLKKFQPTELRTNRLVTKSAGRAGVRIPTGFRPLAQGCEARATLGERHPALPNRNAVVTPETSTIRCYYWCIGAEMRATVALDDDLLKTANEYSGVTERAELIREALKSLIAREAGRRLLALAGTGPNMEKVRRTRVDSK